MSKTATIILPWAAAAAVLLLALLVRFPEPVLGEDQRAEERLPEMRAEVERAALEFGVAEEQYRSFIEFRNMAALRERFEGAVGSELAIFPSTVEFSTVKDVAQNAHSYVGVLGSYAEAGENYLDALRRYDDDLMKWSRSLGAASEQLRDDTFPVVEHVKLYPPPLGLREDPSLVTAAEVKALEDRLSESRAALVSGNTDPTERGAELQQLDAALDEVWESGRSIEYIESLHTDYQRFLAAYDREAGEVSATERGSRPLSPASLAVNGVVGLLAVVGLGLLFSGRGKIAEE